MKGTHLQIFVPHQNECKMHHHYQNRQPLGSFMQMSLFPTPLYSINMILYGQVAVKTTIFK